MTEQAETAESLRAKLPGAWKLASVETLVEGSDEIRRPMGENPVGIIIYTEAGHMAVQIMASGRTPLGPVASDAEVAASARGYVAYSGPFDVPDGTRVVHRPVMSLNANMLGQDQVRYAVCDGKRLELRPPPTETPAGERTSSVIVWERI